MTEFNGNYLDPEPREADPERLDEAVEIPIEDVLDLHTFHPRDVKQLLDEYFHCASEKGFSSVRIVHGKGRGVLRRITESVCRRHPRVASWQTADEGRGGWGATIVFLKEFRESVGSGNIT